VSVSTENRTEELRKWKRDLDARCEAHLIAHPEETAPQHLLSAPEPMAQELKVRCFESLYAPGAWNVFVGDERITTFTGEGAKEKAASLAFDLKMKKPSGSK
jgi:hypothetical protein